MGSLIFFIFICIAIALLASLVFETKAARQRVEDIRRSADATVDGSQGYPES